MSTMTTMTTTTTRRLCGKDMVIFAAMVATETATVGLSTLFKAANSKGMSSYTFLVYSYAIGALFLLPSLFFTSSFSRERLLPPLSLSILYKMGFLGLLGCMYNNLGFQGVKYSSPTLASAMGNLSPAFTFILALIFRMEKVSIREKDSIAKVVGTIVCISGALVATLYHGPPVFVASQPSMHLRQSRQPANSDWAIGGGLLALEFIFVPISYIVQAQVMREYPSEFTVTYFYTASASIFCALVTAIAEYNNPNAWLITSKLSLSCILAAAIINPGNYLIHSWAVRHKGPVFIAMFRPISILIAVAMGAIFLGDSLYLGSLIGGTLISIGFYTVMWGKSKEEKIEAETSNLGSNKVPLLENYRG